MKTKYTIATTANSVFAKAGLNTQIENLNILRRHCFSIPQIFCSLVPLKKHWLQLVEN